MRLILTVLYLFIGHSLLAVAPSAIETPAGVVEEDKSQPKKAEVKEEDTTQTKKEEDSQEENNPETKPQLFTDYLKDRLSLSTSAGHYYVKKDSINWRASGLGDVKIGFVLPYTLGVFSIGTHFRYAPGDISPRLPIKGKQKNTKGQIQSYLLGGDMIFPIGTQWKIFSGPEIGIHRVELWDQLKPSQSVEKSTNFAFLIHCHPAWTPHPSFSLGPDLLLGIGAITTIQSALRVTFIF
jgi:hypothetical protein